MTISYKLIPYLDGPPVAVQMLENGIPKLSIPFYPGNTDYEKYLEWLAEGNEPLPADE